jgi:short-subunit dehydrogenase
MNFEFKHKKVINCLALIGGLACLIKANNISAWLKQYFFTYEKNLLREYGSGYTVITGATDGLGKSYAKEFYKKGFNLILISRNEEKLKSTIIEFKSLNLNSNNNNNISNNQSKIEYITYDFSEDYTSEKLNFLRNKLDKFEVNILINNVGTANLNYFEKISDCETQKIINTNLNSANFLTKILIDQMKQRQNKSLVVFIGSDLVNFQPPFLQLYNATKSFLFSLSESLRKENKGKIDFTYIAPGQLQTKINPRKSFLKIDTDSYAKESIKQFGQYAFSHGHYLHAVKNAVFMNKFVYYFYTEKSLKDEFTPKE